MPRAAFGPLEEQPVEQAGDDGINKFAAVVGVKARDAKRKLADPGVQHGFQPGFADVCGGGHDLPLRHFIDGVDVVDAFGSAGGVARA